MLKENGTVMSQRGDQIKVETISRSSCSHCSSEACSTSVIARLFGLKRNRFWVDNHIQAKKGDKVVIGVPDDIVVKASVWAYLVPVMVMITMAGLSKSLGAPDLVQALMAIVGLFAGFVAVNRLTTHNSSYKPTLISFESGQSVPVFFNPNLAKEKNHD